MEGIIYIATCKTTGKSYIGQTAQSLSQRRKEHKKDSKLKDTIFARAINKYGWDDFYWEILAETKEIYLDYWERRFIYMYDTYNSGYNSTEGGIALRGRQHPMYGKRHTHEAKRKISVANKGKLAGKNNPMYGKIGRISGDKNPMKNNNEARLMASIRMKENNPSKHRDLSGKNNPMYGKRYSEKQKEECRIRTKTRNRDKSGRLI